jgi:hypothetical protein
LNNSGDVSLDYNAKGKIQLKIHSIQHVDEKGTLLSTDVFGEDTKYDLIGRYSTADKEEEAQDLMFTEDGISSSGEEKTSAGKKKPSSESEIITDASKGMKAMTLAGAKYSSKDQTGQIPDAARGQQMPTLVTQYSLKDHKGQIELESFIVTQKGRAGINDFLDVSNGDFKFNLKLTHDGKQETDKKEQGHDDAEPHFVDVQLKIQTETAILPMGNHFYKIVGTGTFLHVPNTFYALDEDSKRMKVQTMEDSYPKLSKLDDDGNQYFTFRFTNASEIFYDPNILQRLMDLFSFLMPQEPPYFQKAFTLEETFTKDEWEMVGSDIGNWVTNVLRAVSGDVTSIIDTILTLLNAGFSNTNSSKKLQLVEWQKSTPGDYEHFPCLVAIKSEGQETVKKAGLTKVIGRKSSAKSASAQVFCIHPGNKVAHKELIGLRSNFVKIANYFSRNFEQDETVEITNEHRGNTD